MTKKIFILILLFGICLPVYAQTKTLSSLQKEVLEKYKDLTQAEWLEKIKYRGLEHKFDKQLEEARDYYPDAIAQLEANLNNPPTETALEEHRQQTLEEIDRMKDKFAAAVKELEYRANGTVKRTPIGTTYYIDFTGGLDANDGLSITTAWQTINKYTTTTTRTAGDIAYVRANRTLTQNTADILCDDSGTASAYISIIGCNATQGIDPWSDGSDVRPIVDFANAAYQVNVAWAGIYWKIQNMEFRQSADANGNVYIAAGRVWYFLNCKFNDSGSSATVGLYLGSGTVAIVEDCVFVDCWGSSLYLYNAVARVINCSFDGGSVRGSSNGIYVCRNAWVEVVDSDFGQTVAFVNNDIYAELGEDRIYCRNCVTNSDYTAATFGKIFLEDEDGVFNTQKAVFWNGILDRVTTPVRTGGASSSLKIAPNSSCTANFPIEAGDKFLTGTFQIYCPSGSRTITVYMYGDGWGASLPSSTECYISASYLNNAGTADRTTIASNDSLAEDSWTAFDVAFTQARNGWVYVTVVLKKYIASAVVYVDIKPVAQ